MNKRIVAVFSLSLLITLNYLRSMDQETTKQIPLADVGAFIYKSNLNVNTVKGCLINRDSEYSREVSQLAKKLKNLRYEFGDIQNVENMYKESSTFQQITLWSALLFISGNHVLQLASSGVKKFWEENPRALNIVDLGFIVFSLLSWGDSCARSEQLEEYRNTLDVTASLQALELFYSKKNSINADTKNASNALIPLIAVGKFIQESSININELQECLNNRDAEYSKEIHNLIESLKELHYEYGNIKNVENDHQEACLHQKVLFWSTLAFITANRILQLMSPRVKKFWKENSQILNIIDLGLIQLNLLYWANRHHQSDKLARYRKALDDKASLKAIEPFYNEETNLAITKQWKSYEYSINNNRVDTIDNW